MPPGMHLRKGLQDDGGDTQEDQEHNAPVKDPADGIPRFRLADDLKDTLLDCFVIHCSHLTGKAGRCMGYGSIPLPISLFSVEPERSFNQE